MAFVLKESGRPKRAKALRAVSKPVFRENHFSLKGVGGKVVRAGGPLPFGKKEATRMWKR